MVSGIKKIKSYKPNATVDLVLQLPRNRGVVIDESYLQHSYVLQDICYTMPTVITQLSLNGKILGMG
jgi:hypothetical protein